MLVGDTIGVGIGDDVAGAAGPDVARRRGRGSSGGYNAPRGSAAMSCVLSVEPSSTRITSKFG